MELIGIEGKDCVGKTFLVNRLQKRFQDPDLSWVFLEEFSASPVGDTIREIIAERRFFFLSKEHSTILAETLLLAADLAYQIETNIEFSVAVIDRGILSLICYQGARLSRSKLFHGNQGEALSYIMKLLSPLEIKQHTILLTVSKEEMIRRMLRRGEEVPTKEELVFLEETEALMRKLGPKVSESFLEIDSTVNPGELTERTAEYILDIAREERNG